MKRYLFSMKILEMNIEVFSICTEKQAFEFLNKKLKKRHGITINKESENYLIQKGEEYRG